MNKWNDYYLRPLCFGMICYLATLVKILSKILSVMLQIWIREVHVLLQVTDTWTKRGKGQGGWPLGKQPLLQTLCQNPIYLSDFQPFRKNFSVSKLSFKLLGLWSIIYFLFGTTITIFWIVCYLTVSVFLERPHISWIIPEDARFSIHDSKNFILLSHSASFVLLFYLLLLINRNYWEM